MWRVPSRDLCLSNDDMRPLATLLLISRCLCLALPAGPAQAIWQVSVDAGQVRGPEWLIDDFSAQYDENGGMLEVSMRQLTWGQDEGSVVVTALNLSCPQLQLREQWQCDEARLGGNLTAPALALQAVMDVSYQPQDSHLLADGDVMLAGSRVPMDLQWTPPDWQMELQPDALAVSELLGLLPGGSAYAAWLQSGHLSGQLRARSDPAGPQISMQGQLHDLAFDSEGGAYAAAGVNAVFDLGWQWLTDGSRLRLDSSLQAGELLLGSLYTAIPEGGVQTGLDFRLTPEQWRGSFQLADDAIDVAGEAAYVPATGLTDLDITELQLTMPLAYERYLGGVLGAVGLGQLQTSGQISGTVRWPIGSTDGPDQSPADQGITLDQMRVDLSLDGVSLTDTQGRFSIAGLDGDLHWNTRQEDALLRWQDATLYRIPLNGSRLRYQAGAEAVGLTAPLSVESLGGRLRIAEFTLTGAGSAEPSLNLDAALEGLSMAALTQALDWPEMQGTLSGRIPGVTWSGGVMSMDGELRFSVFDGSIRVDHLALERPFGVLPTLAADIRLDNLELHQLTGAFSFGDITGRLDGRVQGLRLVNWQPVAFDAWLGSPEVRREPRRISQRAIDNITRLGGGGAALALSNPFLSVFEQFRYQRLGIGCRLSANVCYLRGIEDLDNGFLLVEGAGIPRIRVVGYNPRVDWPQLLAELQAATAAGGPQVGDPGPQ